MTTTPIRPPKRPDSPNAYAEGVRSCEARVHTLSALGSRLSEPALYWSMNERIRVCREEVDVVQGPDLHQGEDASAVTGGGG